MNNEELHGFKKYEKVHAFHNTDEIDGILNGECHIFEKLDGANASVWAEGNTIFVGSRNRIVGWIREDSHEWIDEFRGLPKYILDRNIAFKKFFLRYPSFRFYGEWLVRHTIVYPAEFANQFYIFDIEDRSENKMLPYQFYSELIRPFNFNYLKPLAIINHPEKKDLEEFLGKSDYNACPHGEGVVIKHYGFTNQYGRQPYAKWVTKEFREINAKIFGGPIPKDAIEMKIASEYCTLERIRKLSHKIYDETETPATIKDTGRILGTAYHDIITEDMWHILKKYKNTIIDFTKLRKEIESLAKTYFMGILEEK